MAANIVDKFIKESEYNALLSLPVRLTVVRADTVGPHTQFDRAYKNDFGTEVRDGDYVWKIRRTIKYNMMTTFGDCGSFCYLINTKISGKIIGMHAAGNGMNKTADSVLLTHETYSWSTIVDRVAR